MARVNSPYYLKGRIDCFQFYEMGGKRYVRMVSSLTGKRVKKSPAFARTRESYGRLANASPIASAVYKQLPKEMRVNGFYEKMVGMVILLLKDGYTPEQASALLYEASRPELYEALREADLRKEGAAKGIGASVYHHLPVAMQVAGYEQVLVEMAMQLLEEGMEVREVYELLYKAAVPGKVDKETFADKILQQVFEIPLAESAEYAEKEVVCCDMPP